MFKNYFKVAIRNLVKQKMYSLINIFGLAIGLAGVLLITGYLYNELSFEKCHVKADRIYRVAGSVDIGGATIPMANIMSPMGPAIKSSMAEAETVVRIRNFREGVVKKDDKTFNEQNIMFVDPDFLSAFTYPLIQGDSTKVLAVPNSVVISEKAARKYFGALNPVGQSINLLDEYDLTITGVMANIEANTQIKTDFFASYSSLKDAGNNDAEAWERIMTDYTFLLLKPGISKEGLDERITGILENNYESDASQSFKFWLQPLNRIYLHSQLSAELQPQGSISSIYIFVTIAGILLLIASINYINLVTSKTSHRTTEVGVRKVLGALKVQLIKQFMAESVILCLISMLLGGAIFEILRPIIASHIGNNIDYGVFTNPLFLVVAIIIAIIIGVLSGSYPAFYLSKFKPAAVLKSGFKSGGTRSLLRRILVVTQFIIAIGLIFCTVNLYMQMNHWRTKDRGYNDDNLLIISIDEKLRGERSEILKNEIINHNRVINVSAISDPPGGWSMMLESMRPESAPSDSTKLFYSIWGDEDILKTFDFTLLEGSCFSDTLPVGIEKQVILDEAAVKKLNLENPVGAMITNDDDEPYEVVGVVKDFNGRPMSQGKLASMMRVVPGRYASVAVKLYPDNKTATLAGIEETWHNVFPEAPFEARFLSDIIDETYQDYHKIGILFVGFSILVILIACLGVFALSAYSAEQRYKEIGIRKVLGSTEIGVVKLLTKEFVVLIIIASMVALPLSFILMNYWLETVANRISLGWFSFVFSFGIAAAVTLLTVSYQAIRAAYSNPINAIRHE